jgi:hypothetical protein
MCRTQNVRDRTPEWRDSRNVCALLDEERHLGHIVLKDKKWNAFDATHLNGTGTGFKDLGTFHSITLAKAAVEESIAESVSATAAYATGRLWVS